MVLSSLLWSLNTLATPNYGYEKRQRELAKKKKKEEKARERELRKQQPGSASAAEPMPHAAMPDADPASVQGDGIHPQ
jgi:hypothetical protein